MNRLCNFDILLDLESYELYILTPFYEKDKKCVSVIDNFNLFDTHTHTPITRHRDSMIAVTNRRGKPKKGSEKEA